MAEWQRALRWMQRRVTARDDAMRVDRWLHQQFPQVPYSFLQRQMRQRKIRIISSAADGDHQSQSQSAPAKPNTILYDGATIAIDAVVFENGLAGHTAEEIDQEMLERELLRLSNSQHIIDELVQRIVFQDDNYLVLNKPHGLAVQDGTAVDGNLASYLPALGVACQGETPRLVHRLDKETSGLLVLARHRLAAARFSELLRDGDVKKTYDALVRPAGSKRDIPLRGELSFPIDGKPARTMFRKLDRWPDVGQRPSETLWLELQPVTGRKHQLRIHCANQLNAPVVGDLKYGSPIEKREDRLMLHAKRLHFPDPFRSGKTVDISCDMDAHHNNNNNNNNKRPSESSSGETGDRPSSNGAKYSTRSNTRTGTNRNPRGGNQ